MSEQPHKMQLKQKIEEIASSPRYSYMIRITSGPSNINSQDEAEAFMQEMIFYSNVHTLKKFFDGTDKKPRFIVSTPYKREGEELDDVYSMPENGKYNRVVMDTLMRDGIIPENSILDASL